MALREWVGKRLSADTRLGESVRRVYRRASARSVRVWTEVLHGLAADNRNPRFVQIGANDSGYGDPLRYHILHNHWRGLLIEPLPHIFARLKSRYPNINDLQFANVAIDNTPGERPFYHLRTSDEPDLPVWYDMLGSFLEQNVLDHQQYLADIPERIVTTPVQCQTFDQVCAEHAIEQFDVLHIDAEGYDYELLKTIDLQRYQPTLVLYENKHLSQNDYRASLDLLHATGMMTHSDHVDTLAISRKVINANRHLAKSWRFLRAHTGSTRDAEHSEARNDNINA